MGHTETIGLIVVERTKKPLLAEGLAESKILFELFVGNTSLFQDSAQGALVDFVVHRNNATLGASAQNGMTTFLAAKNKP
jgi:hypothetical protein